MIKIFSTNLNALMASLQNLLSKEIIYLNTQHSFGRNAHICNTCLPEVDISQLHAIISWRSNSWYLNDQSRNGTLVDGKFLSNNTLKINVGNLIQFGANESTKWIVIDVKPPTSYLKSLDNANHIITLTSSHVFPNEETPDIFIYPLNDTWIIENNGVNEPINTYKTYTICDEKFVFIENKIIEDTIDMGFNASDAYFQFSLSSDEEHIHISLITKNQTFDLGERVHNYILLALVRKKLSHFKADYSENDQGWMDVNNLLEELSRELTKEIDIYYLNLKIHRIRKLLLDIKSYGHLFSNIIERRPGEIRFSHPYFKIIKEEICIGEIMP